MKQWCPLLFVWLTWLGLPAIAIVFGILQGWPAGAFVLLVGVIAQVAYLRWFPRISRWIGYGSVTDTPVRASSAARRQLRVTLYTANVCPFCPIVKRRLTELKHDLQFDLQEIGVTFRPQLLLSKGLRSVPVIETNGLVWVGNATSAQLFEFLAGD